jgi:hypothetical protein
VLPVFQVLVVMFRFHALLLFDGVNRTQAYMKGEILAISI